MVNLNNTFFVRIFKDRETVRDLRSVNMRLWRGE